MTRIYYGGIYPVKGAVFLTDMEFDYQILDVYSQTKKLRNAYIQCGYDRELKVQENAKIILYRHGKKCKIISIPFKNENGRLVFDLLNYFKENKMRFKLYKRDTVGDCGGTRWNSTSYRSGFSSKAEIGWDSSTFVDYSEYCFWIDFHEKILYIDWLSYLPYYHKEGNTIFVHAGIDEEAGDY